MTDMKMNEFINLAAKALIDNLREKDRKNTAFMLAILRQGTDSLRKILSNEIEKYDYEIQIEDGNEEWDLPTLNVLFVNPMPESELLVDRYLTKVKTKPTIILSDAFLAMKYLRENNTGTDEAIANIQAFIAEQPAELNEFFHQLFSKSLKLGCTANTVNKVYGKGFIPRFECILAEKYFSFVERVVGRDYSLTLKLDGIRCLVVKRGDYVSLFSRQGQLIEGLFDIENEFRKMTGRNFVLDSELLVSNTTGLTSKEQYKATMKVVRKNGNKTGITYRAFDYLELNEFENQECSIPYADRRTILENGFSNMKHLEILPLLYSGNDESQIAIWLDKVRSEGEEGLMINLNDTMYEFKRTRNLLKVKAMENCDLHIVGFEEGHGRLSGTLGRLNVAYKGNIVGVGSGQREFFWKNQERLVGRVVSVNHFEESQNDEGKLSLHFPIFKELREVGKVESYS